MTDLAEPASLRRRLGCALYELMSLAAVVGVGLVPLVILLTLMTASLAPAIRLTIFQAIGWLAFAALPGLYLTWCWRRGQTLAMRTWGLRIEALNGGTPSRKQVWLRYLYACLLLLPLGLGWWGALLRHDRQFLHDHLAGTRLVRTSAAPATTPPTGPPD